MLHAQLHTELMSRLWGLKYPPNLSKTPDDALLCALLFNRTPAITPFQTLRGAATEPLKYRSKLYGTFLSGKEEGAALHGVILEGEHILTEAEDAEEKTAWVLVVPLEEDVVTEVT